MSSYRGKAINPRTGKVEDAWFFDDYFGRHRYGIQFDGSGEIHRAEDIKLPPRPSQDSGAAE